MAMHSLPCSSVLPWVRPFSSVHLPTWTQIAALTLNSCPKSTRSCLLAPTPSVLLFNPLSSIWGKDVFSPQTPPGPFPCKSSRSSAWCLSAKPQLGFLQVAHLVCVCKVLSSHCKCSMSLGCLQLDFLSSFLPCLVRIKFTEQFLCSWKTLSPFWNFCLPPRMMDLCLIVLTPSRNLTQTGWAHKSNSQRGPGLKLALVCSFASCSSWNEFDNVVSFLASEEHPRHVHQWKRVFFLPSPL